MLRYFFCLVCIYSVSYGIEMQEFASRFVSIGSNGKIQISKEFKHVKLDIGLSYSAPMSQNWLSNEKDLIVFGFEPDPTSVQSIIKGAKKWDPIHGDPLDPKYVGKSFFVFPCALGKCSGEKVDFYIAKNSCGCSSLYVPKRFGIKQVISVPVFRLADFFDLFPFDTHPVIDYIKIDAQGSDLDIAKSADHYLEERVIFITLEVEEDDYENTHNTFHEIDTFMKSKGFIRYLSPNVGDPTYFNPRFTEYIKKNPIRVYQQG